MATEHGRPPPLLPRTVLVPSDWLAEQLGMEKKSLMARLRQEGIGHRKLGRVDLIDTDDLWNLPKVGGEQQPEGEDDHAN